MLVLKIGLWYFRAVFVWYVPMVFGESNLIESSNRKDKNRGDVRRPGIVDIFFFLRLLVLPLLALPLPLSVLIELAIRRDLKVTVSALGIVECCKIGFEVEVEVDDGKKASTDGV